MNGMNGGVGGGGQMPGAMGGGGGMAGFPAPAGYTAELSYIHAMVEELSRQLAENKRVLDDVVTGVGRVRSRARVQQLGNEDLISGASEELQAQETNMDATISALSDALDTAKFSKEANSSLLKQYASVMAGMLKQFHEYKQKHVADVAAWHRSYRQQLADARTENSRLREQIWEMQQHAGTANAALRAFRRKYDEDPVRWEHRVDDKAMRQELRYWKRLAMPDLSDDDGCWSDDDDLIDPAEKVRLREMEQKNAEEQMQQKQLQQQLQQQLQHQQHQLQIQQQHYEQQVAAAAAAAAANASGYDTRGSGNGNSNNAAESGGTSSSAAGSGGDLGDGLMEADSESLRMEEDDLSLRSDPPGVMSNISRSATQQRHQQTQPVVQMDLLGATGNSPTDDSGNIFESERSDDDDDDDDDDDEIEDEDEDIAGDNSSTGGDDADSEGTSTPALPAPPPRPTSAASSTGSTGSSGF